MKRIGFWGALLILCAGMLGADDTGVAQGETVWPLWRGPNSQGVSKAVDVPLNWSETENIAWKVAIPGRSFSSPSVWNDKVFVTTAIPKGEELPEGHPDRGRGQGPGGPPPTVEYDFVVYCFNLADGKELWKDTVRTEKPKEGVNRLKGSYANATPATDGEHVYSFFGSQGLYCHDMNGKLVWEKDFGDMTIIFMNGEGSSVTLDGDRLFVIWDQGGLAPPKSPEEESWIAALDKKTGEQIWKSKREESSNWTTPVVVEHEGKKQVIANGSNKVRAYDYETGEVIWECAGMTRAALPTVNVGDGMVYATSGYQGNALLAIKLGGKGDITGSDQIAWKLDKFTPYVPSALVYQDIVYVVTDKGILSAYDAKTGEQHYEPSRIPGINAINMSPVGAQDRVYFLSEDGSMVVIKAGTKVEVLATNELPEKFLASPAIVNGTMLLRGENTLYCIREK